MREVITRRRDAWRDHFTRQNVEKAKQFVQQVAKLEYVSSVTLHSVWRRDMVVNTSGETGPTFSQLNEVLEIRDSISSFEELPIYVLSDKDRFNFLQLRIPREVLMYKRKKSEPKKAKSA